MPKQGIEKSINTLFQVLLFPYFCIYKLIIHLFMEEFSQMIATALKLPVHYVKNTLKLLESGATIPFISRYRKEATGGMNEVQISDISTYNEKLKELTKRKDTILSTIEEQGKLTDELKKRISTCWDATTLEDIYLPFKPKRKTRAEAARQKGLEPLAMILLMQREKHLESRIQAFIKGEVSNEEEALKGARDIIAEQVNEDERARNVIRGVFNRQAVISAKVVKGKESSEEAAKYRDYFNFSEPLKNAVHTACLLSAVVSLKEYLKFRLLLKMKLTALSN